MGEGDHNKSPHRAPSTAKAKFEPPPPNTIASVSSTSNEIETVKVMIGGSKHYKGSHEGNGKPVNLASSTLSSSSSSAGGAAGVNPSNNSINNSTHTNIVSKRQDQTRASAAEGHSTIRASAEVGSRAIASSAPQQQPRTDAATAATAVSNSVKTALESTGQPSNMDTTTTAPQPVPPPRPSLPPPGRVVGGPVRVAATSTLTAPPAASTAASRGSVKQPVPAVAVAPTRTTTATTALHQPQAARITKPITSSSQPTSSLRTTPAIAAATISAGESSSADLPPNKKLKTGGAQQISSISRASVSVVPSSIKQQSLPPPTFHAPPIQALRQTPPAASATAPLNKAPQSTTAQAAISVPSFSIWQIETEIESLQTTIRQILGLLQSYGPLTAGQLEYNLPLIEVCVGQHPQQRINFHDVLQILVALGLIQQVAGEGGTKEQPVGNNNGQHPALIDHSTIRYCVNRGVPRPDPPLFPNQISEQIDSAHQEIANSMQRTERLVKLLQQHQQYESMSSSQPQSPNQSASTTSPARQKEVLRQIVADFPEVMQDPVYVTALKCLHVDSAAIERERQKQQQQGSEATSPSAAAAGVSPGTNRKRPGTTAKNNKSAASSRQMDTAQLLSEVAAKAAAVASNAQPAPSTTPQALSVVPVNAAVQPAPVAIAPSIHAPKAAPAKTAAAAANATAGAERPRVVVTSAAPLSNPPSSQFRSQQQAPMVSSSHQAGTSAGSMPQAASTQQPVPTAAAAIRQTPAPAAETKTGAPAHGSAVTASMLPQASSSTTDESKQTPAQPAARESNNKPTT